MEPIESVFVDISPKCETDQEAFMTCRFCLITESKARLTRRDLTTFYHTFRVCGLGQHITQSTYYSSVCSYCWVRAFQCVRFIENARRAEQILSKVFQHGHATADKLGECNVDPPVALTACTIADAAATPPLPARLCRAMRARTAEPVASPVSSDSDAPLAPPPPARDKLGDAKPPRLRKKEPDVPKTGRREPAELLARWRALEVEVIKLTEEQQREELAARRRSERYRQWRHKCESCAVGFHEEVSLQRHNLSHDESRGPYECNICHVRFAKQHQLSSHGGGHRRRWRCLRCGETILKNDYLDAHRARCTGSPPVRCDACGKYFSDRLRLRQHASAAHGGGGARRHACDVCARTFRARHHLRYHMRVHTGETPYACADCGKRSATSTAHRIHMTVHKEKREDPETYCVECDKYFKNKNILQIHYRRSLKHNSKDSFPHACAECPERYPAAAALRAHVNSAHRKTRAHRCALCDKAYYSPGTLAVHVKEKHGSAQKTRNHLCTVCSRAFITSGQLKAHTRIHTKERPYACPLCPATFTFNSGLYTHTRSKHKLGTAELKARLGLTALGTPQTLQQQLERQLVLASGAPSLPPPPPPPAGAPPPLPPPA